MNTPLINYTPEGRVVWIEINRPDKRNAVSRAVTAALTEAFARFDDDDAADVAILCGAGAACSSGADVGESQMASRAELEKSRDPLGLAHPFAELLHRCRNWKPVIAAVNGLALGGGLELALLCDIRIAARNATFALTEVKIGSMPGSGGTQRLARLVGMGRAMHLALSGDRVGADDALAMGLVSQVVEQSELAAAAMQLAGRIADNAPLSVQMTRKAIRDGLDMPLAQGLALERTLFTIIRDTQDRAEGRAAFREKRKPDFKGR